MYSVGYLLMCEDIVKSKQTIILNPVNQITVDEFPATKAIRLAFSLVGDISKESLPLPNVDINILFKDPDGKVFHVMEGEVVAEPPETDKESYSFATSSLSIDFKKIEFKVKGMHKIEVLVNQEKKKELLFPVMINVEGIESDENGES